MSKIKIINGMFLSFLFGGILGGTFALLYAPQKGKYLRKDISRKANGLYEEGKKKTYDSMNKAKDKAENIIDSANDAISSNIDMIMRKTEELKDALKSRLNV